MAGLSSIAMRPKYHGPVALYGELLPSTPFRSIPSLAAMPGCHAFDAVGPGGKGGDGYSSGSWTGNGEAGYNGQRLISSSPNWSAGEGALPEDAYIRTYFREITIFGAFSPTAPAISDGPALVAGRSMPLKVKAETTTGATLQSYGIEVRETGFGWSVATGIVLPAAGGDGRNGYARSDYEPAQSYLGRMRYRAPVGNPLNFPRRISDRAAAISNSTRHTDCYMPPLNSNGYTTLRGLGMGGAGGYGVGGGVTAPAMPGCSGAILYWYIYG